MSNNFINLIYLDSWNQYWIFPLHFNFKIISFINDIHYPQIGKYKSINDIRNCSIKISTCLFLQQHNLFLYLLIPNHF